MNIIVKIKADSEEPFDVIQDDIEQELSCCWNWFDKVEIYEEPEGRWEIIHPGETGYSAGDFRCSVCGQPNRCYHLTRYCCNCGARMVNRGKVKKEKK